MAGFVEAAELSDLPEGKLKMVDVEGEEICLINSQGKIYAVQEYCTHKEGPLHEGYLEDPDRKILVCPWHAARFEAATGKVQEDTPWATDIKTFETKVENGKIFVKV